mgnify:CR=1 FL=1
MWGAFDNNRSTLEVNGHTRKWTHQNLDAYVKGNFYLPEDEWSRLLAAFANEGAIPTVACDLPGQFAIVIHDKARNRALLVRDHFGQQPLYHAQEDGRFLFASSIKELRTLSKRRWSIDPQGVYDYFALKYTVPRSTLIQGVAEQRPGTIVEYVEGALREERPYFQRLPQTPIASSSEDESWFSALKEEFERSVGAACFDSTASRVAVLSSGGVDSSVLVAAYRKLTRESFPTFYVGCIGYGNDKVKEAEYVSKLFGTAHQNFYVDGKEFARELVSTIDINDFPLNSPSAVLRNHLYSNISGQVDTLLSGEGADCLYAGYYIFDLVHRFYLKNRWRSILSSLVRAMPMSLVPGDFGRKLRLVASAGTSSPDEYFLNFDTVVVNNGSQLAEMFETYEESLYLPEYKHALAGFTRADILDRILGIYQSTYLSENLATLAKFDATYGVQHRHPFISNSMVEAFNRISWSRKIGRFCRKQLVIEMARDYLPEQFLRARKEGFGVPVAAWFRDPAALGQYVDLLNSKDFKDRGIFKRTWIDKLLSDFQRDKIEDASYEKILWPIVNFELWASRLR